MYLIAQVPFYNEESNYYFDFPEKKDEEVLTLKIDNLSHGCGGIALRFDVGDKNDWGFDDSFNAQTKLQICMDYDKLDELITALTLVRENRP